MGGSTSQLNAQRAAGVERSTHTIRAKSDEAATALGCVAGDHTFTSLPYARERASMAKCITSGFVITSGCSR